MEIINFLDKHQGFFLVLFAAAVWWVTRRQAQASVKYAQLTELLLDENVLIRKAQTNPLLSVSLVAHEYVFGFVDLQIKNEGGGAARNVRFSIEPEPGADEELLSVLKNFGFVEAGISYLGPRQEIRTFFASCVERGDIRLKTRIGVVAVYNTPQAETRTERFVLDFYAYRNYSQLGTPPLIALTQTLDHVRTSLDNLTRAAAPKQ